MEIAGQMGSALSIKVRRNRSAVQEPSPGDLLPQLEDERLDVSRIQDGRDAGVEKRVEELPVAQNVRGDPVPASDEMDVHVGKARHHGLPGGVDNIGVFGEDDAGGGSGRHDLPVPDDDRRVFNRRFPAAVDQDGMGDGQRLNIGDSFFSGAEIALLDLKLAPSLTMR